MRNAKNIYRRRSLVYDTVGHAPLAIDRLLNVRTTLDVLYWSYTDTKHRAASFRQQNFLSGTGFRRRFSVIVPYIIGAPYKLLIRVLFIKPQLAIARLRLHASMMSICLSVCCQNAKTRFSQKLSNLAMVSIYWRPTGSYVSLTGLFKEPIIASLQSKMAEIRHLDNRHDVCRGWSDLDKISQTGEVGASWLWGQVGWHTITAKQLLT